MTTTHYTRTLAEAVTFTDLIERIHKAIREGQYTKTPSGQELPNTVTIPLNCIYDESPTLTLQNLLWQIQTVKQPVLPFANDQPDLIQYLRSL